ncbi:polyunsaturated fatty acid lipoxygenase ALOX15B-like [Thunnus albacares]|uniref:polyunsaturated fatty acid lipoxygenase ALOX15B-like n=1 Tax=Thunnus albacares TaxID=8236 RepID=UPI001CF6DC0C|nr:polyunsaturated fatty acid lipoxygenase ALOX15B-like [Thunnus albacares]
MYEYKVNVITENINHANIFNIYIRLIGTNGQSYHSCICNHKGLVPFYKGAVSFSVSSSTSLGKLLMIELELQKQPDPSCTEDSWFLSKVQVNSPEGDIYNFPAYQWIDDRKIYLREATALKDSEDIHHLSGKSRKKELKQRKEHYRWDVYLEGIPHCVEADSPLCLPSEVRFSFTKNIQMRFNAVTGMIWLNLEKWSNCKDNWTSMTYINEVFDSSRTDISDRVQKLWRTDAFFGYQFLNGVNPMMIQRCTVLPENLPVTDDMVFPTGRWTLEDEMRKGNIFLCDYKLLGGVKTNVIDDKKQYLAAPLVLLHRTDDDELMPIAIQLKQKPAEDNPIFLPTDSEYDWLTAKIFVRGADFNMHQLNVHLLRTHLLAEVFAVSLLRNVPKVHPLYKLLIPHTRYTLHINSLARQLLVSDDGVFTKFAASGGKGMITIMKRAQSSLTYSSLCIPDDIAERGLDSVPNFYYRDDGLRLWDIIHRFVQGLLKHYYKSDAEVREDSELQSWIENIFERGFLLQDSTGIPNHFSTVAEVVKFVTMVIFTCSGQHSAVNSGQYDYGAWMPNTPTSLQRPPPTKKGTTSEETMLQTFPDISTTVNGMSTMWLLSKHSTDFVPLGHYPEEHFTEEIPCKWIRAFQEDLKHLSKDIKTRNKSLDIPYTYLDPAVVENSVAL